MPAENGYLVEIAVYKQLEDLRRRDHSSAGNATFRNDDSLDRYNDQTQGPTTTLDSFPTYGRAHGPIGPQPFTLGSIPIGDDTALEQRMIADLLGESEAAGPVAGSMRDAAGPLPAGEAGAAMLDATVASRATVSGRLPGVSWATGSFRVKAVPLPGVLSTRMRPWCA